MAIVKASISSAMKLCDDYKIEIETTIEFVGKNLGARGIIDPAQGDARNVLQTGAAR
ncbi:hypothetical protein [Noviherbaspirillum soli]|uniref:hypothetical protein n=1 Tax=Noviherbaspirillum soli TaxID=1064518 RepID=UPI00188C60B4|nr:hypothetical protein [Noviherbaspirillum soli]